MEGQRKEILIDGRFYNIENWAKYHPGGKVINYYTEPGEDATIAYLQFHHRAAKKVERIKNGLRSREASEEERGPDAVTAERYRSLNESFKKLHQELADEGMFDPSLTHVFLRILEFFAYFSLSLVIFHYLYQPECRIWEHPLIPDEKLVLRLLGIFMLFLAYTRIVWISHELGHYSFTGHPKVDLFLQKCFYGFGNGLSASWWNTTHNRHHAMPQRLNRDTDLQTLPFLAFTQRLFADCKNNSSNFFLYYQKWLFLPVITFIITARWTITHHPKYCFYKKEYFELFLIGLHFLPVFFIGLENFLVAKWLWGMYLFGNFSVSHTHLDAEDKPRHWVEYGLQNTINVKSSWFMDWWMGYLNFQIEHHLFPTMPEFRNPLIQDRVRRLAEQHNLPYRTLGYFEAFKLTLDNLQDVSDQVVSLKKNKME